MVDWRSLFFEIVFLIQPPMLVTTITQAGLTGDITINENGDREADYTLNDMDPETGFMVPVATYYGARRAFEETSGSAITWSSKTNEAPKDVPRCGFQGEACRPAGEGREASLDCHANTVSRSVISFLRILGC